MLDIAVVPYVCRREGHEWFHSVQKMIVITHFLSEVFDGIIMNETCSGLTVFLSYLFRTRIIPPVTLLLQKPLCNALKLKLVFSMDSQYFRGCFADIKPASYADSIHDVRF